ncbi:hypothetical protein [Streptococcus pacificus]|uniref:Uncharacterized protein n=1 Tax=Streptococcus pacificus TaxID=2740577 RepID=A0ABS0ZHV2_9STRE|nr:hypothetical protein [Streptococcus pacificus]MBJ8325566.1 hypothetical protein [Streptococcus pacificus]
MKKIGEDSRLLASLALFRELYDSEKDVYGVISAFLSEIIKSKRIYEFSLTEITEKLNSIYEFEIPTAVVKTSLSKMSFVRRNNGIYSISDISVIKESSVNESQKTNQIRNEEIFKNLILYIEKKTLRKLTDKDIEEASRTFYSFLLDRSNGEKYIEYISAFILENENNYEFRSHLNLIREGVIIYTGIKFNNNVNEIGSWKNELTIYVDTEILFHLAGYNGELFKNLAMDFYSLVKEINTKAKKRIIKLKYFTEVKEEIEKFFYKAEKFISENTRPDQNNTAMVSIINGCHSASDVISKRSDFFMFLEKFGITEDSYQNYFDKNNYEYNVINDELIEKVEKEIGKDPYPYLQFLNYISILRGNLREENFENIKYILLTGNSITIKVAWDDLLKENGNVPLATDLSFLTNKFWFKLNKGFGKEILPKSFNVISKAQIVLSNVLNKSVGEKYEELRYHFEKGDITKEQAAARISNLREKVLNAEEIKASNSQDILNTIKEDSLDSFIEEFNYQKIKTEKEVEKNKQLQNEINVKIQVENKLKEENSKIKEKLLQSKRQLLQEKEARKKQLVNQKIILNEKMEKKCKFFKSLIKLSLIIYFIIFSIIVCFTWDKIEKYLYIIGSIPFILSLIYSIEKEKKKEVNLIKIIRKIKESFCHKIYNEINSINSELTNIDNEITEIREDINRI